MEKDKPEDSACKCPARDTPAGACTKPSSSLTWLCWRALFGFRWGKEHTPVIRLSVHSSCKATFSSCFISSFPWLLVWSMSAFELINVLPLFSVWEVGLWSLHTDVLCKKGWHYAVTGGKCGRRKEGTVLREMGWGQTPGIVSLPQELTETSLV